MGDALAGEAGACTAGEPVAAAIFFRSRTTRSTGATGVRAADFHSLHFETCYHQGIEYCIEHGLARFEPGTQGEHKVSRGFEPTLTWSAHFIADPRFREAIAEYLQREGAAVDELRGRDPRARALPDRVRMKTITWLSPQDPPEWFPPLEQALDEPAGPARRRRRSLASAAAGRLPARHLSLVFAGAAGALVVARPARRAVSRGISPLAQPRQDLAQRRLRARHRPGLSRR